MCVCRAKAASSLPSVLSVVSQSCTWRLLSVLLLAGERTVQRQRRQRRETHGSPPSSLPAALNTEQEVYSPVDRDPGATLGLFFHDCRSLFGFFQNTLRISASKRTHTCTM
ncbi:hypothetical protein ILYODFUR_011431 [Ilyodon furcidens]|uniref:Secreted protein n=1 Tax=Ilyodon furcidens TaxID=33524 RepID=A0ABV0T747_9TELE